MSQLISLFLIISLSSSPDKGEDPKIISAITIGPIVVPNEFTPPARFSRCDPLLTSPNEITKGFAAVCCNEKPKPTMNSASRTK